MAKKKQNNKININSFQPIDISKLYYEPTGLAATDAQLNRSGFENRYYNLATKKDLNPFNRPENMEAWGAENQSVLNTLGNTALNFGLQSLSGILDGLVTFDLGQYIDIIKGKKKSLEGNSLNKLAKDIRNFANENVPIYNNGKMNSLGYWGNLVGQSGYSIGIMQPSMLVSALIMFGTGGTGVGASAVALERGLKLASVLNFGLSGIGEAKLNALETYENALQEYKRNGYTEEEAEKMATNAAVSGFKKEAIPLALLNTVQFGLFLRGSKVGKLATDINFGYSSVPETLLGKGIDKIQNRFVKGLVSNAVSAGSESFEESLQSGISNYSINEQLRKAGDIRTNTNINAIFNDELLDSAVMGGVTGLLFQGAASGINRLKTDNKSRNIRKSLEQEYENFFKETGTRAADLINSLNTKQANYYKAKEAYENNPISENRLKFEKAKLDVHQASVNTQLEATLRAMRLDNIMQSDKAFKSQTEQLENTIKILKSNDTESLQALGVLDEDGKEIQKGQREYLLNYYEKVLEDSLRINKRMNQITSTVVNDYGLAMDIVKAEEAERTTSSQLDIAEKELGEYLNNKDSKLSERGNELLTYSRELSYLNSFKELTEEQNKRKEELEKHIKDIEEDPLYTNKKEEKRIIKSRVKNNKTYSELKLTVDTFTAQLEKDSKYTEKVSSREYLINKIKEFEKQREEQRKENKKKNLKNKRKEKTNVEKAEESSKEESNNIPKTETDLETDTFNEEENYTDSKAVFSKEPKQKDTPKEATEKPTENTSSLAEMLSKHLTSVPGYETDEGVFETPDINDMVFEESSEIGQTEKESQYNYTPREFNKYDLSESEIDDIKTNTENILKEIEEANNNKFATFEDFIASMIRQLGEKGVEKNFNGLAYAYESTGRKITDTNEVYRQFFKPSEATSNLMSLLQKNPNDVAEEVESEENKEPENKTKASQFKSRETQPKAAFLGIPYKVVKTSDGRIIKINVSEELNESSEIPNHYVLDSNTIKEGTELSIIIPEDVDNIPVTHYYLDKKNIWHTKVMSFKEWVETNNIEVGSEEYYNKVPMIATIKNSDGTEDRIFYLHDTGWYNEINVGGNSDEEVYRNIMLGSQQIAEVRKKISEQIKNGETPKIKITKRSFGQFFKKNTIESSDNSLMTLKEATGDTILLKSTNGKDLVDSGGLNNTKKIKVINKGLFSTVGLLEARPVNTLPDGTIEYVVLPTINPDNTKNEPLSETASNNMKFAFIASIILNIEKAYLRGDILKNNYDLALRKLSEETSMTLEDAKKIEAAILDNHGINITYQIGEYLNMFGIVTSRISTFVDNLYNDKISDGGTFINFDEGIFKIYRKDERTREYIKNNSEKAKALGNSVNRLGNLVPGINYNEGGFNNRSLKNILDITLKVTQGTNGNIFRFCKFNALYKKLGSKEAFVEIKSSKEVIVYSEVDNNTGRLKPTKTYDDFLKENVYTNIKSFEITDKNGNKKWITDIQPSILYEVLDSSQEKRDKKAEETKGRVKQSDNGNNTTSRIRKAFSLKNEDPQINAQTAKTKQEKVEEKVNSDEINSVKEQLKKQGYSEEEIENIQNLIQEGLELDSYEDDEDFNYSARELSSEEEEKLNQIKSKNISGVSNIKQKKIVNNLFNRLLNSIDIYSQKEVDIKSIIKTLSTIVEDTFLPIKEEFKEKIKKLENIDNSVIKSTIDKFKEELTQIDNILKEKNKLVGNGNITENNPDGIKGIIYEKIERFLSENLQEVEENVIEDISENNEENEPSVLNTEEGGFGVSPFTKNHKLKFSQAAKIFFSGIPKISKKTGKPITSFYGLIEYYPLDDVEREFMEILAFVNPSEESVIEELKKRVEQNNKPIYKSILDKFLSTTQEVRNSILYNMIKQPLEMQFVIYSEENGVTQMKVINANSNNSIVNLKQRWYTNFSNSSAYKNTEQGKYIDKEYIGTLISEIDSLKGNLDKGGAFEKFKQVMFSLGLDLEDNVLKELYNNSNEELPPLFGSKGLLTILRNNLANILKLSDINELSIENKNTNPQENAKGVINKLAIYNNKINGNTISKSFRVAGKIVQGTTQRTALSETLNSLKNPNSKLFKGLSEIPYSANSFILELLSTDEEFRSLYNISHTSLQALKSSLNNSGNKKKITELSLYDNLITQLAFFTQTISNLGTPFISSNENFSDLSFRLNYMFIPTISDKDKMVLLHTPTISLKSKDIVIERGTLKLSLKDNVIDFVTNQIYNSEFDRIVTVLNNPTSIKNFDFAASMFLSIPNLNNMVNSNGENILDLIKSVCSDIEATRKLKNEFYKIAKETIREYIESQIKSKIDIEKIEGSFFKSGVLEEAEENTYTLNYVDNFYFNSKKKDIPQIDFDNVFEKAQLVAAEFVLGQVLTQHSVYQLYIGDLANYAVKFNPKKHITTVNGEEQINYTQYVQDIGVNVLKRTAGCEAPGNVLANSDGDSYLHIAVQDSESESDLLVDYIKQVYNKTLTEEQKKLLNKFEELSKTIAKIQNEENTDSEEKLSYLIDTKQNLLDTLIEEFPDVEAYANLTRTDAQEYTTWQEHLDNIFRQGRLTEEEVTKFKSIQKKLQSGEELNSEELSLVLQPIKSVYAGINSYGDDTPLFNRFVYIKSSTIPLLPQVTRGLKIDKVRQHLERLQKIRFNNRTGKPYMVRMSYQSANKVGTLNTKLTMEDLYNKSFEELYNNGEGILAQAISELDRNFFRVQLDVPHKTDKNLKLNKEDSISLGSQMWKMLMSNNINKIKEKVFPNVFDNSILEELNKELISNNEAPIEISDKLSGEDLNKIKDYVEIAYTNHLTKQLYKELSLDENGDIKDVNETLKKIQKILKEETSLRKYDNNTVSALNLVEDNNGVLSFNTPLWLSSGSDKFESLLQAIISNRIINWHLPGNSYVVGSSEGFTFDKKTLEDLDDETKSRIVWTDKNFDGTLKATRIENGELKESEVLLKSHFRVNFKDSDGTLKTELIDLTSDKYSYYDEATNRRYLRTIQDKNGNEVPIIEEELLKHFSFRTPTSSHQSGAILKVVGFLPPEVGDLMIVPAEHTTQLGEDYDIDKRNVYNSNYIVNKKTGKISKLTVESLKDKANKVALSSEDIKSLKQELYDLFKENKVQKELLSSLFKNENINLDSLDEDFKDEIIEAVNSGNKSTLKNTVQKLHKELKEKDKFFEESVEADINNIYETLSNKIFENLLKRNRKKLLENSIVDVYKSVYGSNNSEIQNVINKVLSFKKASEVVEIIKTVSSVEDNKNFSIYSDDYQRQQMRLGREGQLGVAIYSSLIIFHAQLNRLRKPCVIKGGKVTIGNYTSNGVLGSLKTIDGTRLISDVLSELQNSAVDNIKAMIMGYRNENQYTMNVLGMMTLRGFDLAPFYSVTLRDNSVKIFNTEKELKDFLSREDIKKEVVSSTIDIQYPSLFLSQPVLKRYSELKDLSSSEIGIKQSEESIIEQLIKEFTPFISKQELEKASLEDTNKKLTPQVLFNNLKEWNSLDFKTTQAAVLKLFLQFKEESDTLLKYQRMLNLSSTNLGVSYFGVLQRIETLGKMQTENKIEGIQQLVGEFEDIDSVDNTNDKSRYTYLMGIGVKPNTPEGSVLINSLKSANTIMSQLYPYSTNKLGKIFSEILQYSNISSNENLKDFAKKRLQRLALTELKNYINSFSESNSYVGNLEEIRHNLFFDYIENGKQNTSLGTFLSKLKLQKNPIMFQNLFLRSLEVSGFSSVRKPILIRSASDDSKVFEADDLYEDFLQLLQDNTTILGTWQNMEVTPRVLAQLLATYSILSNEEGGVYGFKKMIHSEYLNLIGYNNFLRDMNIDIKGYYSDISDSKYNLNNFTTQFFQHNPEEAFQVNKKNIEDLKFLKVNSKASIYVNKQNKKVSSQNLKLFSLNLNTFQLSRENLKGDENLPQVISFKDGSVEGSKKYKLFFYNSNTDLYERVNLLGDTGYSEYDANKKYPVSNIYKNLKREEVSYTEPKISVIETNNTDNINSALRDIIESGKDFVSLKDIVSAIKSEKYGSIIEKLLPFIDENTDLKIEEKTLRDGKVLRTGVYNNSTNTIYISPNIYNNLLEQYPDSDINTLVEEVILEEFIHSVVNNQLKKYGSIKDGKFILKPDAPIAIVKLVNLYNNVLENTINSDKSNIVQYYLKDIYEFVAGVFVNEDFRNYLDTVKADNGKTLLETFKDIISKILSIIVSKTYSGEVRNTVYDFLNYQFDKKVGIIKSDKKVSTKAPLKSSNTVLPLEAQKKLSDSTLRNSKSDTKTVDFNEGSILSLKRLKNYSKEDLEVVLEAFENNKIVVFEKSDLFNNIKSAEFMSTLLETIKKEYPKEEIDIIYNEDKVVIYRKILKNKAFNNNDKPNKKDFDYGDEKDFNYSVRESEESYKKVDVLDITYKWLEDLGLIRKDNIYYRLNWSKKSGYSSPIQMKEALQERIESINNTLYNKYGLIINAEGNLFNIEFHKYFNEPQNDYIDEKTRQKNRGYYRLTVNTEYYKEFNQKYNQIKAEEFKAKQKEKKIQNSLEKTKSEFKQGTLNFDTGTDVTINNCE